MDRSGPNDGTSNAVGRLLRPGSLLAIGAVGLGTLFMGVALGGDFDTQENTKKTTFPSTDVTARCRGDQHVNFGGFKTNTEADELYSGTIVWPQGIGPVRDDAESWFASGAGRNSDGNAKITTLAYCKGGKAPVVVRNTDEVPWESGNPIQYVDVACPGDKAVIGGGFLMHLSEEQQLSANRFNLMYLGQLSRSGWSVGVVNADHGNESIDVTAIATCGGGKTPTGVSKTVDVRYRHADTATAKCPDNKDLVFGGLQGEYGLTGGAFPWSFYKSGDNGISVYGGGGDGQEQDRQLTAIAYCR
jgi:hypothetical protein